MRRFRVSQQLCAQTLVLLPFFALGVAAQVGSPTLHRGGNTISVEPYASNIVRVTLQLGDSAVERPGYGISGKPATAGWQAEHTSSGEDLLRSKDVTVRLASEGHGGTRPMPLDRENYALRAHYFPGNPDRVDPRYRNHDDNLQVETPDGRVLLAMSGWQIAPNDTSAEAKRRAHAENVPEPEGFHVSAAFTAYADEHFYGLGQYQEGFLDLRGHRLNCWHQYGGRGGEVVCVPFLVSTRGYGILWDNPSKTTVDLAINGHSNWSSAIADRVSFFVITGPTSDSIYNGYRQLTGATPLLPKAAYGYIQSKAIYDSQQEVLDVARGYRDRKLPADMVVVDFLNMTQQGQMDLDPKRWPDPAAMNDTLHREGFTSLLSVWPHFIPGTRYYDMLKSKDWLIHRPDGTPDQGGYSDAVGPNLDTTNPDAARWFWEAIRDNYIKPDHFDSIWLDETEPDVDPARDVFHVGSGPSFYNIYPLFHTAAIYDGMRRDFGESRRVMILARAAYTGAQRNGTVFWSSDIVSTWDMLKRSIPAGLGFTATGLPYWDTDIAGFFSPQLPVNYKPEHTPLVDPTDALGNVGRYTDYPELYVRWFEWSTFLPVMRSHGERMHNEVWSYGKAAETVLSKYLRLRYTLLPYTYSQAYATYLTGAPMMRALFMDFSSDPRVFEITDEYMYGSAFLVAPVTEQGATTREVYLPAGSDWFDYWTHKRFRGGQNITVQAPIDTLPLFVRAGSIVPMGSDVLSTNEAQKITRVQIFPGRDADYKLFTDDGKTYAYEHGAGSVLQMHWDDRSGKLTHTGGRSWQGTVLPEVQVIQSSDR